MSFEIELRTLCSLWRSHLSISANALATYLAMIWPLDAFVCITCQCKIERQFQCKHTIEQKEGGEECVEQGPAARNYCKRSGGAFVFLGRRLNFPAIKQATHKAISAQERWGVSWCACAGMCEPDAGTGASFSLPLSLPLS